MTLEQQRKRFRRMQQEKLASLGLSSQQQHSRREWSFEGEGEESRDFSPGSDSEGGLDVGALRLEDVISPEEYEELMEGLLDSGLPRNAMKVVSRVAVVVVRTAYRPGCALSLSAGGTQVLSCDWKMSSALSLTAVSHNSVRILLSCESFLSIRFPCPLL